MNRTLLILEQPFQCLVATAGTMHIVGRNYNTVIFLPGETLSTDPFKTNVYFVANAKLFEKVSREVKFLLQPCQVFDGDILYLHYAKKFDP